MAGKIGLADIPADVRRKLGIKRAPPKRGMKMDQVRSYSIRVLAVMADLTQSERARVLRQALKLNEV